MVSCYWSLHLWTRLTGSWYTFSFMSCCVREVSSLGFVVWAAFFHVMLLTRLYDASCVRQVRGGAPLVWTVEGVCGDGRPELVIIPRSDRQHRAVWGSVNASLTPHDVITANSSPRLLLHLLTCLFLLLPYSSDLSLLFCHCHDSEDICLSALIWDPQPQQQTPENRLFKMI